MSGISTHVLDLARGRPGTGVDAILEFRTASGWEVQGGGTTDDDGRINNLLAEDRLARGTYRVTFDTRSFFRLKGRESIYPQVVIVFEVERAEEYYHIPLLLNSFGYTTYRGS